MSINGVDVSSRSLAYLFQTQKKQTDSFQTETSDLSTLKSETSEQKWGTFSDNTNSLLASEIGKKVQLSAQQQDSGFTAEQLNEMVANGSPMSELFSALAEHFEEADTNGDGVVKRDEAMAYAQENDIDMPPPPENKQPIDMEKGLTLEQLTSLSDASSPLNSLFNALAENFEQVDSDADGVISREEAMTFAKENDITLPESRSEHHAEVDRGLTVDEFKDLAEEDSPFTDLFIALVEHFDEVDSDSDGVVTHHEAITFAKDKGLTIPEPGSAVSISA